MRGGDPKSRSPLRSGEGLGLIMSNIVPFPTSRRVQAKAIPREEFEQLAELALDVVERIVALLDDRDGDAAVPADRRGASVSSPHSIRMQSDRFGLEVE